MKNSSIYNLFMILDVEKNENETVQGKFKNNKNALKKNILESIKNISDNSSFSNVYNLKNYKVSTGFNTTSFSIPLDDPQNVKENFKKVFSKVSRPHKKKKHPVFKFKRSRVLPLKNHSINNYKLKKNLNNSNYLTHSSNSSNSNNLSNQNNSKNFNNSSNL